VLAVRDRGNNRRMLPLSGDDAILIYTLVNYGAPHNVSGYINVRKKCSYFAGGFRTFLEAFLYSYVHLLNFQYTDSCVTIKTKHRWVIFMKLFHKCEQSDCLNGLVIESMQSSGNKSQTYLPR
jgi:hypothetical protein